MAKETAPIEALEAFIDRHESQANKSHLVVTQAFYPGAQTRVFPGRHAGIPVADGKAYAIYSDGSKHQ